MWWWLFYKIEVRKTKKKKKKKNLYTIIFRWFRSNGYSVDLKEKNEITVKDISDNFINITNFSKGEIISTNKESMKTIIKQISKLSSSFKIFPIFILSKASLKPSSSINLSSSEEEI